MSSLISLLRNVLLHNIGDHRICPSCGHSFIPNDTTQQDTVVLYNTLFEDRVTDKKVQLKKRKHPPEESDAPPEKGEE